MKNLSKEQLNNGVHYQLLHAIWDIQDILYKK